MADVFNQFLSEVKRIEEKDSVYTSDKQIERLLRPGSSYANLNPFDVLLIDDPETAIDIIPIRKQYKKLSILLHPDKNPENREKAQTAFDILNKAYKALEDEKTRNRAMEVVEEAKFKINHLMEEKRKKLKKEGRRDCQIEEDNPEKYRHSVKVLTMKLFADYERKRRAGEERAMEERKRKREGEIEEEEKVKNDKEWNKNFEESREVRVSSWQSFSKSKKTTTQKSKRKEFRPPKHNPESR